MKRILPLLCFLLVFSIIVAGTEKLAFANDLMAWGEGTHGRLLTGTGSRTVPTDVLSIAQQNVVKVVGRNYTTIALKSDGTIVVAGNNGNGQLGIGFKGAQNPPIAHPTITDAIDIALGTFNGYILKSDGTVWAAGDNWYGQIGDGTTTERLNFVQVQGLTNVVAISAGTHFAVALKSDGTVWTWGRNSEGQLGNGTYNNSSVPVQVTNITNAISISAFDSGVIALLSDGTVRAWGQGNYGTLGNNSNSHSNVPVTVMGLNNIISVSAGGLNAAALRSDGTVWTWGQNYAGSLGNTTIADGVVRSTPIQVQNLSNVVKISSRGTHVLALRDDGDVFAWGGWSYGEIGDGTTSRRYTPVRVLGINNVANIFAGEFMSFALVPQNIVSTLSISGPSGMHLGQSATYVVTTTTRPTGLSVKYILTCPDNTQKIAENSTGSATFTCSGSEMGGVGNKNIHVRAELSSDSNRFMEDVKTTEVYASSLSLNSNATEYNIARSDSWLDPKTFRRFVDPNFKSLPIMASSNTTQGARICYLKKDGSVWCHVWDQAPTQLSDIDNVVKLVHIGGSGFLALRADGSVWAWGTNSSSGALGLGHTSTVTSPTRNNFIHNIVDIGAGSGFAFAIKSDGTVYGWGDNSWGGPLCLGNENSTSTPVGISSMQGAKSIWGGTQRSAFIRTEGGVDKLYECGRDIGSSPVYRSNMDGTVKVQIGHHHNVALKSDGTVWVWGNNSSGQLGLGHTNSANPPYQQIPNFTGVVDISVGNPSGQTTIALKSDGTVWGWGSQSDYVTGLNINGYSLLSPTLLPVWLSNGIFMNLYSRTATYVFYTPPTEEDNVANISITGTTTAQQYDVGNYTITSSSSPVPHLLLKYIITCPDNSTQNTYSNTGSASFQCVLTTIGNNTIQARVELAIDNTKFRTTSMVTVVSAETPIPPGSMMEEFSIMSSGSARVNWVNGNTFAAIGGSPSFIASSMTTANNNGSCFLRGDKTVWCSNGYNTPTRLPGIRNVKKILGIGYEGFLALREDGTVWGWGGNSNGRLGLGDTNSKTYPTMITGLSNIVDIGAGSGFAFAIKSDGTVYGWGDNEHGNLCKGDNNSTSTPVGISSMQGAKSIWGGTQRSAFIKTENGIDKLYECGRDIGTSPVYRSNMDGTVKVQIGNYHNVALKSDGTVWVWGNNGYGQLGLGHTNSANPPYQQIPNFTGVVDISVGSGSGMHTLALKSDKTAFGWGWGIFTPFGLGPDNGNKTSPTLLPITGVKIFAGGQLATFVFTELPDVQSINITGPEEVERGQNATYTITAVTKPTTNLSVKYTLTCPDNSTQTATNTTGSATLTCSAASMGNTGNKTISAKAELESDSSKFKTTTMSTLVYCPAPSAGEITGAATTFTLKAETYSITAFSSCGTVTYSWSGTSGTSITSGGSTANANVKFTTAGQKTLTVRVATSNSPTRYVDKTFVVDVTATSLTINPTCDTSQGILEGIPFTCSATGSSNWGTPVYKWRIGANNYNGSPMEATINTAGNYNVVGRLELQEDPSVYMEQTVPITVEGIPLNVSDITCDSDLYVGKSATCTATMTTSPGFTPIVKSWNGDILSPSPIDNVSASLKFVKQGENTLTITASIVERPAKNVTFQKTFTVSATNLGLTVTCPESVRTIGTFECSATVNPSWGTPQITWMISRGIIISQDQSKVTFRALGGTSMSVTAIARLTENTQISQMVSKNIAIISVPPPTLSISGPISVLRKSTNKYTATAFSPVGDTLIKWYVNGEETSGNSIDVNFPSVGIIQITAKAYIAGYEDIEESTIEKTINVVVRPYNKPIVDIKQDAFVLFAGQKVTFNAIVSSSIKDSVIKKTWTLPDGTIVDDMDTLEFSMSEVGTYTVTLTAWHEGYDNDDEKRSVSKNIVFRGYSFPEFEIKSFSGTAGFAPYDIVLISSPIAGTNGVAMDAFSYDWYVNGELQSGDNKRRVFSYTFDLPGEYVVKLVVKDASGNMKEVSQTFTAEVPPDRNIEFKKIAVKPYDTAPMQLILRANISGGNPKDRIIKYEWFVNNNLLEKIKTSLFAAILPEPGEYEVKLKITTKTGRETENTFNVTVLSNEPPTCDFNYKRVDSKTLTYKFIASCNDSDGKIVGYEWDLGNGATSKSSNAVVKYEREGTYTVVLTATDNNGASTTVTKEVNIGN